MYYAVSYTRNNCVFFTFSYSDIIFLQTYVIGDVYPRSVYCHFNIAFHICNCAKYSFINNIFSFIHSVEPISLADNSMSYYATDDYYTVKEKCSAWDIWGLPFLVHLPVAFRFSYLLYIHPLPARLNFPIENSLIN